MMVCTVTVFVVANSFHCVYFLLWTHEFYSKETANLIWITKNLVLVVNSSVIVVIYSLFCKTFRAHFRAMLPKMFGGQGGDSKILMNSTGNPSTIKLNIIKSVRSTWFFFGKTLTKFLICKYVMWLNECKEIFANFCWCVLMCLIIIRAEMP